jgi:hypothetical protein
MLATTILAVYLGLLRAVGLTWSTGLDFLTFCAVLTIPGCLLLKITARAQLAWLPAAVLIGLLYLFLGAVQGRGLPTEIAAGAMTALTAELVFIGGALLVLRVAGIQLALPESPRQQRMASIRRRHAI